MLKKKKYYLAYGSNLNVEQMGYRCPGAVAIGTAVIEDYELLFKGSQSGSYLTIEEKVGESVPVAVWAVDARHEAALDRYEGFPTFYYKKTFKVQVQGFDGSVQEMDCFAYIMHEDRPIGIPSQYYVDACAEGYNSFGFDLHYLGDAYNKSVSRCIRRRVG